MDATFELSSASVFRITYRFKAGGRESPRAVNSDYHEGLELLLARLSELGAVITDVRVDSSVARDLPVEARRLGLSFPLRIDRDSDVSALRLDITRAQKPVARRPSAKPGGGNDQKTIVITCELDSPIDYDALTAILVGPAAV